MYTQKILIGQLLACAVLAIAITTSLSWTFVRSTAVGPWVASGDAAALVAQNAAPARSRTAQGGAAALVH